MACQAKGWNGCTDWLHKGRTLMVGRKRRLLSFWKCVLFCPLSQRSDTRALKWARGEPKTHFPLHPALSGVARGTLEAGGSETRAPPLSAWLIRRTSEAPDPRRSWAGVLGASGRGSVMPSVSALSFGATDTCSGGRCSYPVVTIETSRGCTTILWALRELRGRRGTSIGRGPDGALGENTRPACCEMAPQAETIWVFSLRHAADELFIRSESWALREADDGKRVGSVTKPNNSPASEATRERLSSNSLSLAPNKIMLLAAAEGTLIVLSEEDWRMLYLWWWRGTQALSRRELTCHRLLESSVLLFFPHMSLGERNGRARGVESLSEKKAICEHREARLKLLQWDQSVPLSAASVWDFPKHDTHSAWVSSAYRGDLHETEVLQALTLGHIRSNFLLSTLSIVSTNRCSPIQISH